MDNYIKQNIVLCGEVGLAGEVRSINRLDYRLNESILLGFVEAIVPYHSINEKIKKIDIKIHPVKNVKDVFNILF